MLPYGIALWNDLLPPRPAELRDIPLGTHLHGSFCLPPTGEEKTIPSTMGPPQYGSKYNHAVLLEDDFSFFQRRGLAWRVVEIDRSKGRLEVAASGKTDGVEFQKEHNFWIDDATRLWKGARVARLGIASVGFISNTSGIAGWRVGSITSNIWVEARAS